MSNEVVDVDYTTEFVVPEKTPKEIWDLHMERYKFASKFVKGKTVLDVACGTGYGSQMLIDAGAKGVFGADIHKGAIAYARDRYKADFRIMDCNKKIEFKENSFDVVVSFSTIEHLVEWMRFINEVKRVLKPNGTLLISISNHKVSLTKYRFHLTNFKKEDFLEILKKNFTDIEIFGQGRWFFSYPGRNIIDKILKRKRDISTIHKFTKDSKEPYELIYKCKNGVK